MSKITADFFEFTSYSFNERTRELKLSYRIAFFNRQPLLFTEKIIWPKSWPKKNISPAGLTEILQGVHLISGLSYYKLYCPRKIKIPYALNKEQADFWNLVYRKGLGEFFFRNKLNPQQVAKFPYRSIEKNGQRIRLNSRSLVGIGGGKDSAVAAELLKANNFPFSSLSVETEKNSPIVRQVMTQVGAPRLVVKRILDPKIFLNYPDSYNGHIPISAIFAWLGVLTAFLYDYKYFIVGNEWSSNFGQIKYRGLVVNHQWSKSLEFELALQNYLKKFISPDLVYFSLLRSFYEIKITQLFSRYPQYWPIFSGCNRSYKVKQARSATRWCGRCPKCAFIFLLLAAWLPKQAVIKIFGRDLLDQSELSDLFKDLLGWGKMKPFDCVGTFAESRLALKLAAPKFKNSLVVKQLARRVKTVQPDLLERQPADNLPDQFKFLIQERVLLLGYGREGRATEKYLQGRYPQLKISKADQKFSADYLSRQKGFDLIVKTPGLPKKLMARPYTTATNIFFSQTNNLIIGVTGSKGKSTTASLIAHILKTAGQPVKLLGNIGAPMLGAKVGRNDILVLELSSYQLDDLHYSPQIAVVTNLFPEHMDYHGSAAEYYAAKKNIINFQTGGDHFIYQGKNKILQRWAKKALSQAVDFSKITGVYPSQLIGQHNQENIKAAVAVAKIFKIEDRLIQKAVQTFRGLEHRLQKVGAYQGITFYDDAISTTPESTIEALKALPKIGTIFLGGQDRGYDFRQLEKEIKKAKIKNIVLFPDSGQRILARRQGLRILETERMAEAVEFAFRWTPRKTICLLSCASPSYSLWQNFEAKGEEFRKEIIRYNKKEGLGKNKRLE